MEYVFIQKILSLRIFSFQKENGLGNGKYEVSSSLFIVVCLPAN